MVAYGTVSTASATSGTSYNAARPASTVDGDILVAFAYQDGTSHTALTLSGGSTWSLLQAGNSSDIGSMALYWKQAGASEPTNYTAGKTSGTAAGIVIIRATSGAATAPVFAVNLTGQDGTTSISTPSVTPSGTADLLIRFAAAATFESVTWTAPASHTERADFRDTGNGISITAATRQLAAGGATGTANFTASSTDVFDALTATVAITDGSTPQDISPTGIASGEAFGAAKLNFTVSPSGVASAETFGGLVISTPEPQFITAEGVASGEAFGTLTTRLYLGPSGIASTTAFGAPRLAALIGPSGIPSAEAFGVTNAAIEQFITPTGIASREAFGSTVFQLGYPQTIEVVGIESREVVEDPHVRNLHRLLLVNPSIQETPAAWDRLHVRFGIHRGITIIKDADGVWSSVRYPAQTEIEAAQKVFLGGRRHDITPDEAEELTDAGYGSYITLEPA